MAITEHEPVTEPVAGPGSQSAPEPETATPLRSAYARVQERAADAADIVTFSGSALRSLPKARLYVSEIFRQTGILIFSSGLVIWFMMLTIGAIFASVGTSITGELGAQGLVGIFPGIAGPRFSGPMMWGWILSAKVGCGIVAEFGSMRISDEIDALEVMGISAKPYLVGTRLIAVVIAMPFLYIVGLGLLYLSSTVVLVDIQHTVSSGGFFQVLWTFQQPLDLFYSLLWALISGLFIVTVACYYGYTVQGGPVEVGRNAAKSMVVNLVAVSIIGMFCEQLFWGAFPHIPIGN